MRRRTALPASPSRGIAYDTKVAPRIVLDTNVFVAAIRSRRGAAFKLVSLIGKGLFDVVLSVPLALEYEDALLRHAGDAGLNATDIEAIVDRKSTRLNSSH